MIFFHDIIKQSRVFNIISSKIKAKNFIEISNFKRVIWF